MNISQSQATDLRRTLADVLAEAGALRSHQWRRAVETVPREVFLGDRVYQRVDAGGPTQWRPRLRDDTAGADWLRLAYTDETLVTQLKETSAVGGGSVLRDGEPTSSSTLPSLVVRMLEDLQATDDTRVLEIGTGTGYATALMCARFGADRVTSIEVDPDVAARAAHALTTAGYTPRLVTGDGLAGENTVAPYDRVIATCSVRHIPQTWLDQTRSGGIILAPLSGWLLGHGLIRLHVTTPGYAEGCFLPGFVQFMPARAHAAPPLYQLPETTGETERATDFGPDLLTDWTGRFLAQLAAPGAQYAPPFDDAPSPMHLLYDQTTGAWARLYQAPSGRWRVRQAGSARLWDDIETALSTWCTAGRPAQSAFRLTLTPTAQHVRLNTPTDPVIWELPFAECL